MFTTRPELIGTFGVVASTHWLASATGMAILEKGGNAFDAAVAMGFCLQVVEPHFNGPGGEVPMLIHDRRRGGVEVVCGQGVAPAAATIARFRDLGLDRVPGSGLLAAVVPGAVDAWLLLLRDHGTLGLAEVMEHALAHAERGYPVVPGIATTIETVRTLFEDEWVSSAELYLPHGDVPAPGSLLRNPDLARTWRRMLAEAAAAGGNRERRIEAARRCWRDGFIAEAIDRFCRTTEAMDTSSRRHRGLLTGDDMARWQATIEAPATYDYHGYTVCKCGPWSQGPVFLQQLALLAGSDIGELDPLGADFVHLVCESAKLAFADREAFYGDPEFVDVPLATLLADDYNRPRRKLLGKRASRELRPGTPAGRGGAIPDAIREHDATAATHHQLGSGEPVRGRGDTCHLDVIDRQGNMVSATPSGGWLAGSPVIPGLGFCLTNRGQMFWLDEASPSALAPGRRPRTTLSPSLALRHGEPYLAFGTPGGDQQDQWSLVFFLRHIHHGMNLQEAIDAPSFHTEHLPSSFWPREVKPAHLAIEGRFPRATIATLKRRGHAVAVAGDWSLGRLTAASRNGDILKAAANPRFMQGYAIGR